MRFEAIQRLCVEQSSFAPTGVSDALFLQAMRENYEAQWESHAFIRELGRRRGFSPASLVAPGDALGVPPLFVGIMKLHAFLSVAPEDVVLTLTSSGTAGQKTQISFDQDSLARLQTLANAAFEAMGFRSATPAHVFLFSYDPRKANDVGTTWSDEQIMGLSPVLSHHWTITWNDSRGAYDFDSGNWAREFVRLAQEAPVRFLGFPAFMYQLVEELRRQKIRVKVHPESFIVAGGGWKNHQGTAMTLRDFCDYMEEHIGFPRENVRDTFGMAEHGVPYCSCPRGHFHAPIQARIVAREPLSLREVAEGEEGLLHLLTPYNTTQPNLSVLSTDVVTLGSNCPCGVPGTFIRAVRRGGIKKHRGCAIAAQEILNRS